MIAGRAKIFPFFAPGRCETPIMTVRRPCLLLLVILMAGCASPEKKKKEAEEAAKPKITDQSADPMFQSFIGRLRIAVSKHDVAMVASMMTPDFGYRLEPLGEGDGVFQYWDENNVWPDLDMVLHEKFGPSGVYMVAPVNFATDPNYTGYRAGLRQVNGGWRFAYFVNSGGGSKPMEPAQPHVSLQGQ